jgi:sugar lactone lactonase YvrE
MKLVFAALLTLWGAAVLRAAAPTYTIETVAGSSHTGDGGPAIAAELGAVQGAAADGSGNLYLSDCDNQRVRKVDAHGAITTLAGTGTAGFSGDGGPAASARLNFPYGLAVDSAGNVYIADLGNNRVRRVSPDGTISTLAGTGAPGSLGDGGPAVNAQLAAPRNLAVDGAGNLYISEFEGHRIRKIGADGMIATIAGSGIAGFGGDGGPATGAELAYPAGLAVDAAGTLYIADTQNQRVRTVAGGVITTLVGGSRGTALYTPTAVAVDSGFNLYVADWSGTVRSYSPSDIWATVAGTATPGYSGDGGPAAAAQLADPRALAFDLAGDLYIADGTRVREVNPSQIISTVAGDGYLHAVGDGGPATSAILFQPSAVALDFAGNLYIADSGTQRVRMVTPVGAIGTLAGTGTAGYNGDAAAAAGAPLNWPMGVALDAEGDVLIADTDNDRIREVGTGGGIANYAGTGSSGTGPEFLLASQTPLAAPRGVCVDYAGTVYVADTLNHRVLLASGPSVVIAAGTGAAGDAGDGGPARLAQLNQPSACALDSAGDLFIADTLNHRIRRVAPNGNIATVAGTGTAGFGGDEGPATSAALDTPRGVAVDDAGDIFIADTGNQRIRLVTPDGAIHTIAGQTAAGFAGDGAAAVDAQLNAPTGMILDGSGNLYFADSGNNRVRLLVRQAEAVPSAPAPGPPGVDSVLKKIDPGR